MADPAIHSGARYPKVPLMDVSTRLNSRPISFAIPKSATLGQRFVSRTLELFHGHDSSVLQYSFEDGPEASAPELLREARSRPLYSSSSFSSQLREVLREHPEEAPPEFHSSRSRGLKPCRHWQKGEVVLLQLLKGPHMP
ncbi:hypothetical protein ACMD2_24378 [Ananas comosus]|uniref:Uncharacterized protein n=1 Tax=Ananas comosus TaxID=4615 RepID=A0A199W2P9_ANACO|nr:hypothetical protein ACMD2_24378 [Ananas comosus]